MRRHRILSVAVVAGITLALLGPKLAEAGPIGDLANQAPVAGPVIDPDDDGNADLPVLSEDTCPGHDDAVDQDSDGVPDACDGDRDGDGVANGSDLWPDDRSQTVDSDGDAVSDERDACAGHDDRVDQDADGIPDGCDGDRDGDGVANESDLWPDNSARSTIAHAVTAYATEFRAGDRTANAASELAVSEVGQLVASSAQHAWSSGLSEQMTVQWSPATRVLRLTVGGHTSSLTVASAQDIRVAQIQVSSKKATMTASLSGLAVNAVAQSTGPISATNSTVTRGFGSVSWNQGFTLTGMATFSFLPSDAPKTSDLQIGVLLGR